MITQYFFTMSWPKFGAPTVERNQIYVWLGTYSTKNGEPMVFLTDIEKD